jgi:hypothetical protein
MRRFALLAMLALGVGCDDPEVAGTITDALQYGGIKAQASCQLPITGGTMCNGYVYRVNASLFLDGSSFVTCMLVTGSQYSAFNERGHAVSVVGNYATQDMTCSLVDGQVSLVHATCTRTADMSTYCTGRNLEAFGVE